MASPDILVNERTVQGSSPVMVAVKYGQIEATQAMVLDPRVDLELVDKQGRDLSRVVGVADTQCSEEDKVVILETIKLETQKRLNLRNKKRDLFEGKIIFFFG